MLLYALTGGVHGPGQDDAEQCIAEADAGDKAVKKLAHAVCVAVLHRAVCICICHEQAEGGGQAVLLAPVRQRSLRVCLSQGLQPRSWRALIVL